MQHFDERAQDWDNDIEKVERALELQHIEKAQAEADQLRLNGAAELIKAIGDNNAVVQIGSLLIVIKQNKLYLRYT